MLSTPLVMIGTAILLVIAAYAQYRIPFHTKGSRARGLRALLAVTGLALGGLSAAYAWDDGHSPVLLFLAGFALPHMPAAIILLFKRARGEGLS
jgi:hypothetical protein